MITAALVKELRDKTGAGILDCKKALTETNGDIEKAVVWLREQGIATAAKKSSRIAAEGLTRALVIDNEAIVLEMNSETDFVAKNELFLSLLDNIAHLILKEKPANLEAALALNYENGTVNDAITNATATIGEKITLRRFELLSKTDDQIFGSYMHMGGTISAISVLTGGDDDVAKNIAMQVASMSPSFVKKEDMDETFINNERAVQKEIVANDESLANKPEKVLAGIIEGRLSKSLKELCLVDQIYFKEPDLNVGQYLKNHNAVVDTFVRYAVGEGIEKREDNFVEEVMSQAFGK